MTNANTFPHAPCIADQRDAAALRDHLSREVRSSQALQARVAELEGLLTAERAAREVEVVRLVEAHAEEMADLRSQNDPLMRCLGGLSAALDSRHAEAADHERHVDRLTAERDEARVLAARFIEAADAGMRATAEEEGRMRVAARHHAREVIWSWMNSDKHVPHDWTAAHPPDDMTAQVLAEMLGDDGFTMYSEAFRAAWTAEVEAIADAREARHGSGKVKV